MSQIASRGFEEGISRIAQGLKVIRTVAAAIQLLGDESSKARYKGGTAARNQKLFPESETFIVFAGLRRSVFGDVAGGGLTNGSFRKGDNSVDRRCNGNNDTTPANK